jgi:hypothetical protein
MYRNFGLLCQSIREPLVGASKFTHQFTVFRSIASTSRTNKRLETTWSSETERYELVQVRDNLRPNAIIIVETIRSVT